MDSNKMRYNEYSLNNNLFSKENKKYIKNEVCKSIGMTCSTYRKFTKD